MVGDFAGRAIRDSLETKRMGSMNWDGEPQPKQFPGRVNWARLMTARRNSVGVKLGDVVPVGPNIGMRILYGAH